MANKYYAPVIMERFNNRQFRRHSRRGHVRRLADIQRHNVVPLDGPAQDLAVGKRSEELAVFDNKAANDVLLDAEAQIKSGYPTIATSTLVKHNPIFDTSDDHSAIKFFSELVKPVKYRWKFEKEKLKTIMPSKQGFHQRSHSPTFQRLVEANEKLQGLVNGRPEGEQTRDESEETKSEITHIAEKPAVLRYAKSESQTNRNGFLKSGIEASPPKLHERVHSKPENRVVERQTADDACFPEDEDDNEEDYKSGNHTPKKINTNKNKIKEFKVDFKKMDSHSELHLFLPHIEDAHSRIATPDNLKTRHKVALPIIAHSKDASDLKVNDEDKMKPKKSQKSEQKKKKKRHLRIKSGNDEKEFRDRLNDVPTLISLEKEKNDFHSNSMCVFENCAQHSHFRKSSKIRQA